MMIVWLVGGWVTGMLINHLIIIPIERKRWRRICEEEGLVPEGFWEESEANKKGEGGEIDGRENESR